MRDDLEEIFDINEPARLPAVNLAIMINIFKEGGPRNTTYYSFIGKWITEQKYSVNEPITSLKFKNMQFTLYFMDTFINGTNAMEIHGLYPNLNEIKILTKIDWANIASLATIQPHCKKQK